MVVPRPAEQRTRRSGASRPRDTPRGPRAGPAAKLGHAVDLARESPVPPPGEAAVSGAEGANSPEPLRRQDRVSEAALERSAHDGRCSTEGEVPRRPVHPGRVTLTPPELRMTSLLVAPAGHAAPPSAPPRRPPPRPRRPPGGARGPPPRRGSPTGTWAGAKATSAGCSPSSA